MKTFPYKDEDINRWIYDSIPASMEVAISQKQLANGSIIFYRSTFSSLAGYFIATKVNATNLESVLEYLKQGNIYVKKTGVSYNL